MTAGGGPIRVADRGPRVARRVLSAVPVRLRGRRSGPTVDLGAHGRATACGAPSIQLRLDPNGLVSSCCKSLRPLGHISRDTLIEIWNGDRRRRLEQALGNGDFSQGCEPCEAEIDTEGRPASYAAYYDEWSQHLGSDAADTTWPTRLELNLSNSCNLQCIQCDGDSSSAIRIHREGRRPLPKVYDESFFAQLRPFLPHLERIVFGGGEPFLAQENFRVWDLVAEINPSIDCQVITNATQWTPRIEKLLSEVRFSFIFSLDGITEETFESIRIGADFGVVMRNLERLLAHTRQAGTSAMVNHCLMPQNHHEFAELLLWAEERDLFVNASVVRYPAHASIARLPADELGRVLETLEADDERMRSALALNRRTWELELGRIRAWASAGDDPDAANRTIMWFRCGGDAPHGDQTAREELAAHAWDGEVHVTSVGDDDRIRWTRSSLLGPADALAGETVHQLTKAVTEAFGEMNHYEVVDSGADRVDAVAVFGSTEARIVTVAIRDDAGWADEARILISFAHAPPV